MCRLHGSPPLYAGPSHPYPPIHNPYPYISVCSGDQREIFWEMCYLLQSLESEGMGLPRDVPSGATCVGFTAAHHCALTIPTILCHTPTMHRGVKGDVHGGQWGDMLASSSWGKLAKLPIVLCERALSHLGAWLAYGTVWWEWAVCSGGLQ